MKPPRTIKTRRLLLCAAKMNDARAIFETYASDSMVTRYLAWKEHKSIRETQAFLRYAQQAWRKGTEYIWTMNLKTGGLIGGIGMRPGDSRVEIGYVTGKQYWGKGFTTEAARAVLKWALKQKMTHRVWATCDVENIGSARVLEKLGMQREGVLRKWIIRPAFGKVPRDCFCYSIVKGSKKNRGKNRDK